MTFPVDSSNVKFGPNVLVTGASGFVGNELVQRLLELGLNVRAFDINPYDFRHPNLVSIQGDIRDADTVNRAVEGVQTIFHAAAVICLLGVYRKAVREFSFGINVGGTQNILDAARRHGVKQLVHTSSHNVCMDRPLSGADESQPYAQTYMDLYTETKVIAEQAVLGSDNIGDLRTAAIRPGGIWGPSRRSVMINILVEQVTAGKFAVAVGSKTAKTDCSHVQNVADAEILAAQKLATDPDVAGGQPYFITDGEPFNQLLWAEPLVTALGHPFPKIWLPGRPFYPIARALEWAHKLGGPEPDLTKSAIWKLTEDYWVRIDKARRELGYTPRVNRESGMKEVIPYARQYAAELANR
ncbi:MAG: NAD-dependent epimerase/dehydratase family protein [Candidatus Dadabacteria bacterium]|nr:MAG: NAD-dependent epimerase/dehydratase family protein [Candidatus Dadabacteria bacterium]